MRYIDGQSTGSLLEFITSETAKTSKVLWMGSTFVQYPVIKNTYDDIRKKILFQYVTKKDKEGNTVFENRRPAMEEIESGYEINVSDKVRNAIVERAPQGARISAEENRNAREKRKIDLSRKIFAEELKKACVIAEFSPETDENSTVLGLLQHEIDPFAQVANRRFYRIMKSGTQEEKQQELSKKLEQISGLDLSFIDLADDDAFVRDYEKYRRIRQIGSAQKLLEMAQQVGLNIEEPRFRRFRDNVKLLDEVIGAVKIKETIITNPVYDAVDIEKLTEEDITAFANDQETYGKSFSNAVSAWLPAVKAPKRAAAADKRVLLNAAVPAKDRLKKFGTGAEIPSNAAQQGSAQPVLPAFSVDTPNQYFTKNLRNKLEDAAKVGIGRDDDNYLPFVIRRMQKEYASLRKQGKELSEEEFTQKFGSRAMRDGVKKLAAVPGIKNALEEMKPDTFEKIVFGDIDALDAFDGQLTDLIEQEEARLAGKERKKDPPQKKEPSFADQIKSIREAEDRKGIDHYRKILEDNIAEIQKVNSDFTMTEEEKEAMLSQDRIDRHKAAVELLAQVNWNVRNASRADTNDTFRNIAGYLCKSEEKDGAIKENEEILRNLSGTTPASDRYRRNMLGAILKSANSLSYENGYKPSAAKGLYWHNLKDGQNRILYEQQVFDLAKKSYRSAKIAENIKDTFEKTESSGYKLSEEADARFRMQRESLAQYHAPLTNIVDIYANEELFVFPIHKLDKKTIEALAKNNREKWGSLPERYKNHPLHPDFRNNIKNLSNSCSEKYDETALDAAALPGERIVTGCRSLRATYKQFYDELKNADHFYNFNNSPQYTKVLDELRRADTFLAGISGDVPENKQNDLRKIMKDVNDAAAAYRTEKEAAKPAAGSIRARRVDICRRIESYSRLLYKEEPGKQYEKAADDARFMQFLETHKDEAAHLYSAFRSMAKEDGSIEAQRERLFEQAAKTAKDLSDYAEKYDRDTIGYAAYQKAAVAREDFLIAIGRKEPDMDRIYTDIVCTVLFYQIATQTATKKMPEFAGTAQEKSDAKNLYLDSMLREATGFFDMKEVVKELGIEYNTDSLLQWFSKAPSATEIGSALKSPKLGDYKTLTECLDWMSKEQQEQLQNAQRIMVTNGDRAQKLEIGTVARASLRRANIARKELLKLVGEDAVNESNRKKVRTYIANIILAEQIGAGDKTEKFPTFGGTKEEQKVKINEYLSKRITDVYNSLGMEEAFKNIEHKLDKKAVLRFLSEDDPDLTRKLFDAMPTKANVDFKRMGRSGIDDPAVIYDVGLYNANELKNTIRKIDLRHRGNAPQTDTDREISVASGLLLMKIPNGAVVGSAADMAHKNKMMACTELLKMESEGSTDKTRFIRLIARAAIAQTVLAENLTENITPEFFDNAAAELSKDEQFIKSLTNYNITGLLDKKGDLNAKMPDGMIEKLRNEHTVVQKKSAPEKEQEQKDGKESQTFKEEPKLTEANKTTAKKPEPEYVPIPNNEDMTEKEPEQTEVNKTTGKKNDPSEYVRIPNNEDIPEKEPEQKKENKAAAGTFSAKKFDAKAIVSTAQTICERHLREKQTVWDPVVVDAAIQIQSVFPEKPGKDLAKNPAYINKAEASLELLKIADQGSMDRNLTAPLIARIAVADAVLKNPPKKPVTQEMLDKATEKLCGEPSFRDAIMICDDKAVLDESFAPKIKAPFRQIDLYLAPPVNSAKVSGKEDTGEIKKQPKPKKEPVEEEIVRNKAPKYYYKYPNRIRDIIDEFRGRNFWNAEKLAAENKKKSFAELRDGYFAEMPARQFAEWKAVDAGVRLGKVLAEDNVNANTVGRCLAEIAYANAVSIEQGKESNEYRNAAQNFTAAVDEFTHNKVFGYFISNITLPDVAEIIKDKNIANLYTNPRTFPKLTELVDRAQRERGKVYAEGTDAKLIHDNAVQARDLLLKNLIYKTAEFEALDKVVAKLIFCEQLNASGAKGKGMTQAELDKQAADFYASPAFDKSRKITQPFVMNLLSGEIVKSAAKDRKVSPKTTEKAAPKTAPNTVPKTAAKTAPKTAGTVGERLKKCASFTEKERVREVPDGYAKQAHEIAVAAREELIKKIESNEPNDKRTVNLLAKVIYGEWRAREQNRARITNAEYEKKIASFTRTASMTALAKNMDRSMLLSFLEEGGAKRLSAKMNLSVTMEKKDASVVDTMVHSEKERAKVFADGTNAKLAHENTVDAKDKLWEIITHGSGNGNEARRLVAKAIVCDQIIAADANAKGVTQKALDDKAEALCSSPAFQKSVEKIDAPMIRQILAENGTQKFAETNLGSVKALWQTEPKTIGNPSI